MTDPTWNKEEINANPIWKVAWIISECVNDNAPIGWSKYIHAAEEIQTAGLLNVRMEKEVKVKKTKKATV